MKRSSILVAALLATTACTPSGQSATQDNSQAAKATKPDVGIDLAGLDKTVKPGNDFEEYANGTWRKNTKIPPDRSSTGVFLEVFKKAEAHNRQIVDDAVKANAAEGTDTRRIADYYKAFMDTNGIEQRGLAPLKADLDAISAVSDKQQLSKMLGANIRADVDPLNATDFETPNLFGIFVSQAFDHPNQNWPYVLQGGLGLPGKDYYTSSDGDMAKIRSEYKAYIAKLLTLAGIDDADARAQRIFDLEMKIAKTHEGIVESQDAHKADNPWMRSDFAKKAPGIDWDGFWNAAQLGDRQGFIVWQPQAVIGSAKLVQSEPLQAWKDWLTFHAIDQVTDALPKKFDDAHFAFYSKELNGTPEQRPRDQRAISSLNRNLGDAVGKLYAERYFPASSKADIQNMVQGILAAFHKRVENLTWMTPKTKQEALKKIETMHVGIGYPESWRDYSGLVIKPNDPVGNLHRAEMAEYKHQLAKLNQAPDKDEWWMTPQTVNAVNLPLQNALNFPAAILQAPFYDPNADPAANYGSIGAVIGHEISHSFDNLGADFDAEGRLRNWWTPEDLKHFEEQGQALVKQFNAYEPLPGIHINGQQTLGENIADVAGLTAAYEAYHASLNGKEAPVIDGLTGDQRFFLAFAQSWREKIRDKALKARIATDAHAPAKYRAETVRNLDAWYKAFDVKPNAKLYLPADKRVHVW
ncbi:M13 family metallopeptidase [Stakelama marina]|uniref:M13 family metallopeptidase n=1 Tax=Stakelama marina TaxID=2826939 RepID=A0A8T4IB83_9SPHN|nr:M13 family metallopeptidase [Stakelama marina]MBR0551372.1 M13 family metallopeptidase [Stakelama marina]